MKKLFILTASFFILFFIYSFLFKSSVGAVECNEPGGNCAPGLHCCAERNPGNRCIPRGISCSGGGHADGQCCGEGVQCGVGLECVPGATQSCGYGTCQSTGGSGGGGSKTCNQFCVNDSSCISGLSCVAVSGTVGKRCRASNCQNDAGCGCANTTPTPTGPTPGGPTPTTGVVPTDNPNCSCNNLNKCSSACTFEGVSGTADVKCELSTTLFQSTPADTDKTDWCQRPKRTKGDANGDYAITNLDYMYYVSAVNGGKIPVTVNPDFNGDGEVGAADRTIIIGSL